MILAIKEAIGRLEVIDYRGKVKSRGTAFLAAPNLLLTAYHVIAKRNNTECVPLGIRIEVIFIASGRKRFLVRTNPLDFDEDLDFAALELFDPYPNNIKPIIISTKLPKDMVGYSSYGFPKMNPNGDLEITGHIVNTVAHIDEYTTGIQLFSNQAGAPGAVLKGLSGAPCIVDDRAVGIIRSYPRNSAILSTDQVAGGTLFAGGTNEIAKRPKLQKMLNRDPCIALPPLDNTYTCPKEPFIDLLPYTDNHARVFFGRCKEIGNIIQLMTESKGKPLILCGQSGVGKTSLICAGLIPRTKNDWDVRYATRSQYGSSFSSFKTMVKEVISPPIGARRLIIIDQLEEAFTRPIDLRRPTESARTEVCTLCSQVAKHLSINSDDRVIFAFRKEWLAEYQSLITPIFGKCSIYHLNALNYEAIEEVVLSLKNDPFLSNEWNATVDDAAASKIAETFSGDEESAVAPQLQIFLKSLWDIAFKNSKENPYISQELVDKELKSKFALSNVFDSRLAKIYKEIPFSSNGLALDLLRYHITPSGTSEIRKKSDLVAHYSHIPEKVNATLNLLKDSYLIINIYHNHDNSISSRLSHDILGPLVLERYSASALPGQRARRILESRVIVSVEAEAIPPLGKFDLQLVESGRESMRALTEIEDSLLIRSKYINYEDNRKEKVNKIMRYVLLITTSILFGFVLFFLSGYQDEKQLRSTEIAERAHLSGQQAAFENMDYSKSLIAERFALKKSPPENFRNKVYLASAMSSITLSPIYSIALNHQTWESALSADGKTLIMISETGAIKLWDVQNLRTLPVPSLPTGRVSISPTFDPTGHRVAVVIDLTSQNNLQGNESIGVLFSWDINEPNRLIRSTIINGYHRQTWNHRINLIDERHVILTYDKDNERLGLDYISLSDEHNQVYSVLSRKVNNNKFNHRGRIDFKIYNSKPIALVFPTGNKINNRIQAVDVIKNKVIAEKNVDNLIDATWINNSNSKTESDNSLRAVFVNKPTPRNDLISLGVVDFTLGRSNLGGELYYCDNNKIGILSVRFNKVLLHCDGRLEAFNIENDQIYSLKSNSSRNGFISTLENYPKNAHYIHSKRNWIAKDGKRIISVDINNYLIVWSDVNNYIWPLRILGDDINLTDLVFNDQALISVDSRGTIKIWPINDQKQQCTHLELFDYRANSAKISDKRAAVLTNCSIDIIDFSKMPPVLLDKIPLDGNNCKFVSSSPGPYQFHIMNGPSKFLVDLNPTHSQIGSFVHPTQTIAGTINNLPICYYPALTSLTRSSDGGSGSSFFKSESLIYLNYLGSTHDNKHTLYSFEFASAIPIKSRQEILIIVDNSNCDLIKTITLPAESDYIVNLLQNSSISFNRNSTHDFILGNINLKWNFYTNPTDGSLVPVFSNLNKLDLSSLIISPHNLYQNFSGMSPDNSMVLTTEDNDSWYHLKVIDLLTGYPISIFSLPSHNQLASSVDPIGYNFYSLTEDGKLFSCPLIPNKSIQPSWLQSFISISTGTSLTDDFKLKVLNDTEYGKIRDSLCKTIIQEHDTITRTLRGRLEDIHFCDKL